MAGLAALCLATSCTKDTPGEGTQSTDDGTTVESGTETGGETCDPIKGPVQIPCIERNAVAAMRAINALSLSNFLADMSKISFDTVVKTMYETGTQLKSEYRETSEGGLAKHYIHS